MGKFRRKPIEVDAIQWDGTMGTVLKMNETFGDEFAGSTKINPFPETLTVATVTGEVTANKGDWVIRGPSGEFFVGEPDAFAKVYDEPGKVADAHLIAAAPEMFAALSAIIPDEVRENVNNTHPKDCACKFCVALRVLAKARGEAS